MDTDHRFSFSKKTEFIYAGQKSEFPHRKSSAKSDAAGVRIGENGEASALKNPVNTVIYEASIGQAGLNNPSKTSGKQAIAQAGDAKSDATAELLRIWHGLSENAKQELLAKAIELSNQSVQQEN